MEKKYYYFNKRRILELDTELKVEDGYVLGTILADAIMDQFVPLTEQMVAFREANPNASIEEVFNCELRSYIHTMDPAQELWQKKHEIISQIQQQDKASESFIYINDINEERSLWLNKENRVQFGSILLPALKAQGIETVDVWEGELGFSCPVSVPVPVDALIKALPLLEIYAAQTYSIMQANYAKVMNSETIEELEAIDITAGFPEKIIVKL